ncbi:TIGR03985 family CRISPR-associated protein [Trichothermofontia sp.]
MTETVFTDRPSLELLQWLARGSLKQNLLRAIRLWVLLHKLYGPQDERLDLSDRFTYAEWRSAFFGDSHPTGEEIPGEHDPGCACATSTEQWLGQGADPSFNVQQWRQALQQHTRLRDAELDACLSNRLFARTRRSLQADFQALVELQWLDRQPPYYIKVNSFLPYPTRSALNCLDARFESDVLNFLNPDLASLASLSQVIGGYQRFFLHVDYIVPKEILDRVEDWQEQLRQIWAQKPIPPIAITYYSARTNSKGTYRIYPICIYYAQRAAYLCALGETPIVTGQSYYNYRLDRIQALQPLTWQDPTLPACLTQHYQQKPLPTPDDIANEIESAWGFDFYLPEKTLLLRFERNFHDRYIRDTFRHDTFRQISYQQAQRLIRQNTSPPEQQQLLAILRSRSETDAYYQATYRDGDTNIKQRLRAWRPRGEILLPWSLRQAFAQEAQAEYQLYQSGNYQSGN